MLLSRITSLFTDSRLIRYALSGAVTYGVEIGGFFLLYYSFHYASGVANATAYIAALVINYLLARFVIFNDRQKLIRRSLIRYGLLAAFNLLAGTLLIMLLVDVISLSAIIAKPLLSILIAIWTYYGFKRFVFV